MDQEKVMEVFVQIRKTYNLLGEIMDLTRQMAESLDREDNTAFQMVLSMRRDPIQELAATRERIEQLLLEFPASEQEHLRNVLNGAPGATAVEKKMAEQTGSNTRLLQQVTEADRRLSEKVAHGQSVYNKK